MLYVIIFVFNIFILINSKCPPGSVTFFSDKTRCLYFQPNKTYFLDAEQACMDLGGHLTSVHNSVDNMFLSQQALVKFTDSTDSDFWFGANDLYSPQKWSWMDNSTFDFENWDKGQPQDISGNDCGAVFMNGGKWKTDDCYTKKPFVCAVPALDVLQTTTTTTVATTKTTTIKPKSCPDTWTFYNTTGFCYRAFVDNTTWLEAEESCKVDDAHLVSIHSSDENNFVAQLATFHQTDCDWTKEPWVGFYTEDNNAKWKWTDGTPFDYTNWSVNQPDNPGVENCGQIVIASQCWTPGQFNNYPCKSVDARFICKRLP